MRKLVYTIHLSIDGCVDHTKLLPSEEMHDFFTELIQDAGLLVYGCTLLEFGMASDKYLISRIIYRGLISGV